jgi:hypothetical protein
MGNHSFKDGKKENNQKPKNEIIDEKEILPESESNKCPKLKNQKVLINKKEIPKINSELNDARFRKLKIKDTNFLNYKRKRCKTFYIKNSNFKKIDDIDINSTFDVEDNFKIKKCNNLKECEFKKYLNKIKEEEKMKNSDGFNIKKKNKFNNVERDEIDKFKKTCNNDSINNKMSLNPNENNDKKDNINSNGIPIKKESNDISKNDLNENIIINDIYNNNSIPRDYTKIMLKNKNIIKEDEEEIDLEEYERLLNRRKMIRTKAFININKCESIDLIPQYFSVLENANIFNLLLIMLNNISDINDYIANVFEETINNYDKENQNCLAFIVYYINKYLWRPNESYKVTRKDLSKRFKNFINIYSEVNCIDQNPNNYCYDRNNVELIFTFIFHKINGELTQNNFNKEHYSLLFHNFYGLMKYQIHYRFLYKSFYRITFNINEISHYYMKNINNMIDMNNSLNLLQCFDYNFLQNNRKTYTSYCNSCNLNGYQSMYNFIYDAPKILALILSKNNENCNLNLQDELNINRYMVNSGDNDKRYLLISVLCQIRQSGKYICYSINQNDGHWYSYSDERIEKVLKIDINTVLPLILFYQEKNTLTFKYNKISLDTNNIFLKIKNSQFATVDLLFNKNSTIKNIVKKTLSQYNLKDKKGRRLINGEPANENELLSKYLQPSNNATLIIQ